MIVVADTSPLNSLVLLGHIEILLAEAARRNLLDLPQALAALQATNFHVSPKLIEIFLTNDVKQRGLRSRGKATGL